MAARFGLASLLAVLLAGSAAAQTVYVNENFDSYLDSDAFRAAWVPTIGLGTAPSLPADDLAGLLTGDPLANVLPGTQGKAIDHIGATATAPPAVPTPTMVNQWGGKIDQTTGVNPAFTIPAPNASLNVLLKADVFVGTSGNERMSVGLRHTTAVPDDTNKTGTPPVGDPDTFPDANTVNIIELGSWNANGTSVGPLPGSTITSNNYAFRVISFASTQAPLTGAPNWQFFDLDPALDGADANTTVNSQDIGAAWHTYSALVSPTSVTITLDLYRDGKRNTSSVPDGEGNRPGVEGEIDVTVVIPTTLNALGFNNLRIGGPSGNSSAGTGLMGFDNILLQSQSVVVPPGDNADFDGDGDVDGADFLTWQRGLGGPGDLADGDANDDGNVTAADLEIWKQQFGPGAPTAPAVGAVPEPATLALAAAAMLAGLAATRRR
jgi:hypothetical protein